MRDRVAWQIPSELGPGRRPLFVSGTLGPWRPAAGRSGSALVRHRIHLPAFPARGLNPSQPLQANIASEGCDAPPACRVRSRM
eukprot:14594621-Alexandrium_andersonii.AAC.1